MNTIEQQFERAERTRKIEEAKRNEQRHFDYNSRRRAAGLPELSFSDYLARKYGYHSLIDQINQQRAAKPVNRDNILLFNR